MEPEHASSKVSDMDYHSLNAMLNLYDENGKIQFDKDKQAAHQYFLQHVNQNTVFFHNLREKLEYLTVEGYYEQNVLDQYSFNFVRDLYDHAYDKKASEDRFSVNVPSFDMEDPTEPAGFQGLW